MVYKAWRRGSLSVHFFQVKQSLPNGSQGEARRPQRPPQVRSLIPHAERDYSEGEVEESKPRSHGRSKTGRSLAKSSPSHESSSTGAHTPHSMQKTSFGTYSLVNGNSVRLWQPGHAANRIVRLI